MLQGQVIKYDWTPTLLTRSCVLEVFSCHMSSLAMQRTGRCKKDHVYPTWWIQRGLEITWTEILRDSSWPLQGPTGPAADTIWPQMHERPCATSTSVRSAPDADPQTPGKTGNSIVFAALRHQVIQVFVKKQQITGTHFDIRSEVLLKKKWSCIIKN